VCVFDVWNDSIKPLFIVAANQVSSIFANTVSSVIEDRAISLFQMPQTVPSAGFTPPCDYTNFAADSFDLSLLPCDCEVPYSPTNLQQLMSLYCDPTGSPPPMFPEFLDDLQVLKTMNQQHKSVKEEPPYFQHQGYGVQPQPSSPAGSTYTNNPSPYQHCPSPSATAAIKHEQTIDLQEILQESRFLQESLGSGRTLEAKKEPQETVSDCAVASTTAAEQSSNVVVAPEKPCADRKPGDHQLLREVLRDMSFQRKYNLKPFDFDGLAASGFLAGVKTETEEPGASCSVAKGEEGSALMSIEPVLSLAIEQIRVDISNTCSVLGIASGEYA
jgi:SAM pointed domain-containing ETS transcription factor